MHVLTSFVVIRYRVSRYTTVSFIYFDAAETMDSVKQNIFETSSKIPDPGYLKVDIVGCFSETDDILKELSIDDLFTFMCESDDYINALVDEAVWNVFSRSQLMSIFGYNTITTVLKNVANLNHNIRLFNEYVHLEDQTDIKISIMPKFSTVELNAIVKFGIHMIQSFISEMFGKGYESESGSLSDLENASNN
jgi:hypothetical protein